MNNQCFIDTVRKNLKHSTPVLACMVFNREKPEFDLSEVNPYTLKGVLRASLELAGFTFEGCLKTPIWVGISERKVSFIVAMATDLPLSENVDDALSYFLQRAVDTFLENEALADWTYEGGTPVGDAYDWEDLYMFMDDLPTVFAGGPCVMLLDDRTLAIETWLGIRAESLCPRDDVYFYFEIDEASDDKSKFSTLSCTCHSESSTSAADRHFCYINVLCPLEELYGVSITSVFFTSE